MRLWLIAVLLLVGCGGPAPTTRLRSSADAKPVSPLGPSYVLLPAPNDDDSLLGRVVSQLPHGGQSLEEIARPNPCAEHLGRVEETSLSSTFEDAQELSIGASARATLAGFGLSAAAERATHLVYRIETERRLSRLDSNTYLECCAENDCGYGYVSAMIYGAGEYTAAEESFASGSVEISLVGAEGEAAYKVLHRRSVRGFLAALITITDAGTTDNLTSLGVLDVDTDVARSSELLAREIEREKIEIESYSGERTYAFVDIGGPISENEFLERYRLLLETDELEHLETYRCVWCAVAASAALVVGGGLIGLGIWGFTGARSTATDGEAAQVVAYGGVIAALGIGAFVADAGTGWMSDGGSKNHELSELDARLLARRYNRALLRKASSEVQLKQSIDARPAMKLKPLVGFGALGLSATW